MSDKRIGKPAAAAFVPVEPVLGIVLLGVGLASALVVSARETLVQARERERARVTERECDAIRSGERA